MRRRPRRSCRRARGSDPPLVEGRRDAGAARRERRRAPRARGGGRPHMGRRATPPRSTSSCGRRSSTGVVAYEPAEMIVVVEAGMRVGELGGDPRPRGQEWPVDAPADATVGGVIAAGASSPAPAEGRHVRDTVVEVELVTGDGRAGPKRRTNGKERDRLRRTQAGDRFARNARRDRAGRAQGSSAASGATTLRAEGGLALGTRAAGRGARCGLGPRRAGGRRDTPRGLAGRGGGADRLAAERCRRRPLTGTRPFPSRGHGRRRRRRRRGRGPALADRRASSGTRWWTALVGVGLVWFGLGGRNGELGGDPRRVGRLGGIAPVVRGPGGLGDGPVPRRGSAALETGVRPAGVLAPGRSWTNRRPGSADAPRRPQGSRASCRRRT